MTLAMALDNSFEIMNAEEMYGVNGGFYFAMESVNAFMFVTTGLSIATGRQVKVIASAMIAGMARGAMILGALGAVVLAVGGKLLADLAWAFAEAAVVYKTGVDIKLKTKWFIPYGINTNFR